MNEHHDPQHSLFRGEVLARAGVHAPGRIVLAAPAAHGWLTMAFALQATALLLWLCMGSYTHSATIGGVLTPAAGMVRVLSPQDAIVGERLVQEGQRVAAGELLFRLQNTHFAGGGDDSLATTARLLQSRRDSMATESRQQLLQGELRLRAFTARRDQFAAALQHTSQQVELQQQRIALADAVVQRYRQLQSAGFVAAAQLQEREAELLDQRQRLADLERERMGDLREQAQLGAELREQRLQVQRDQQNSARGIAALDQEIAVNDAQREQLVRAPVSGILSGISVARGQSTVAGQPLVSIIPGQSPLEAELYAPSSAAGFLRAGMAVRLRYQAYPYQKFGQYRGHIREVSGAALPADEFGPGASAPRGAELLYRVRVSLERQTVQAYGQPLALRAGTSVSASIPLDRRRLIEWLLAPLRELVGPP